MYRPKGYSLGLHFDYDGYKPVQPVTVLNSPGVSNKMPYVCLTQLNIFQPHYILTGPVVSYLVGEKQQNKRHVALSQ